MNPALAKRNLRLLPFFSLLRSGMIIQSVLVVLYQTIHMDQTGIFLLQAVIYGGVAAIGEVPGGIAADWFGRRRCMLIGVVICAGAFGIYCFAQTFTHVVVAEVALAIGSSLISNADKALQYDSLQAIGAEDQGKFRAPAKYFRYAVTGQILAGLASAVVVPYGIRAAAAAQVVVYLVPLLWITALLHEPVIKQTRKRMGQWAQEITGTVHYALQGHKEVKWLILYGALMGSITYPLLWLAQPYYQLLGISEDRFGLIWAAQYAVIWATTWLAHPLATHLRRFTLVLMVIAGISAYLALGLRPALTTLWVLVGFFFIRGVADAVITGQINTLVPSSKLRAGILSTQSLVLRVSQMAVGLCLGILTDRASLLIAFQVAGGIFALWSVIVLLGGRKFLLQP